MRELPPIYRREDDHTLIEIRLENVRQLFDNRDPAPFRLKDLDRDAAEYIEGAAEELPSNVRLKLVVHLPAAAVADAMTAEIDLVDAVHTFFAWQSQLARNRLAALLSTGRLALAIGLMFLALCLALSGVIGELGLGWFGEAVGEGLVIFGWVALWRPGEIFLYDWWPLLRHRRQMDRLAGMPVELRAGG